MILLQNIKRTQIAAFTVILTVALLLSAPSYAEEEACIPGIPCITPLTPNSPHNPEDGPNILGPNKDKIGPSRNPAPSEDGFTTCDADFMNQIYSRAFIEAERENVLNQIVIRKPDSVLEYSCFEENVSNAAHDAGPLFSESRHWDNKQVIIGGALGSIPVPYVIMNTFMGDTKLDNSLELLVLDSLKQYINENFAHDFLGGYATGFDSSITGSVGDADYSCNIMRDVYNIAKCTDFLVDDKFFDFSTLASLDPRILPSACSGTAITDGHIELANNDSYAYVNYDPVLANTSFIKAGACGSPIPTGVLATLEEKAVDPKGNVKITKTTQYMEKICVNPGCYYDQKSRSCKN